MVSGSKRVGRLQARNRQKATAREAVALKAVGYLRVSTEAQATAGHGLDAQAHAVKAFAASQGYELLDVVTDGGVSGATRPADRPGFARALALAAEGRFSVLLVKTLIVWDKGRLIISRGHYHWRHEPCWYAVRKGRTAHWAGDRKQTTVWLIPHRRSATDLRTARPPPKVADAELLTPEHRAWREQVLQRAGFRCEGCGATGVRLFADHKDERRDGGAALDINNGACLCGSCHSIKTARARIDCMAR